MSEGVVGGVSLVGETWTPCSANPIVLEFLRAEWDKWPILDRIGDRRLVTEPDLTDDVQNKQRMRLLWRVRGPLLHHIPSDTRWFEVQRLSTQHFWQLRAINHKDWISPDDRNELEKVAIRNRQPLMASIAGFQPILWGHDKEGPFTILEGNHRLTALAGAADRHSYEFVAYVGLSAHPCGWHRADGVW